MDGDHRRRSASFEFGVVENCAANETFGLNGYDFTFDACAIRGERPHMEDRWCAVLDETKDAFVLGVFDGHGGAAVSAHLSRELAREVLADEALREDPASALKRAFKRVDDVVCAQNPGRMKGMYGNPGPGSTAIVALIMPPVMYVANVGDSRATALDDRGRVTFESVDQRPTLAEEKDRITGYGGFVKRGRDGVLRTGGILAVSRAFGNAGIKRFLSVEPEVTKVDLDSFDSLILCSDGLTDVMGSKLASETMRAAPIGTLAPSPSPVRTRRVANSLVTLARVRQSKDNISAVVLQVRRAASIAFPSLETPAYTAQTVCKTPETVQYDPMHAEVSRDGFEGVLSTSDEERVELELCVDSDLKITVRVNTISPRDVADGLCSPPEDALRESTQAITPIGANAYNVLGHAVQL